MPSQVHPLSQVVDLLSVPKGNFVDQVLCGELEGVIKSGSKTRACSLDTLLPFSRCGLGFGVEKRFRFYCTFFTAALKGALFTAFVAAPRAAPAPAAPHATTAALGTLTTKQVFGLLYPAPPNLYMGRSMN